MDPIAYEKRRAEIIGKFPEEFILKYREDQWSKNIIEQLIRGASPYEVLDLLLTNRLEMQKKIEELVSFQPPPPIQVLFDETNSAHLKIIEDLKSKEK